MRFAAVGRAGVLYDAIRACVDAGHECSLIGTCEPSPEYGVTEADFRRLAGEVGAEFFAGAEINTSARIAIAREARAEIAISFNWRTLIGAEFRGAFRHGVVNAHPGDLPRYRGNACPTWAILNGEPKVVLSLHRMTDELDAGPVFRKRSLSLSEDVYIADVYAFLRKEGPTMFVELLHDLEAGTATEHPQPADPTASLRCFPRRPEDGLIDWSRDADSIARLVRATSDPLPGAFSYLDGEPMTVWRARALPSRAPTLGVPGQVVSIEHDGWVRVLAGEGFVGLEEVETEYTGRSCAAEVVSSTRQRLGSSLAIELEVLRKRIGALEQTLRELGD